MTKTEAKNVEAGDTLTCPHNRKRYTVSEKVEKSDDPRDALPMFIMTDGAIITHRLLEK